MHPTARAEDAETQVAEQMASELTSVELLGLVTLGVRNGMLQALAFTAVVSLLLGFIIALLR